MQNPTDNERDDAWLLTGDEPDPRVKPGELRARDEVERRLLRLMRALPSEHHALLLAVLDGMARSVVETDAEIVALADAIMAGSAETDQLSDLEEAAKDAEEKAGLRAAIQVLVSQHWNMRATLAGLPATTLAGWRAKARMVRQYSNCSDGYADGCNGDTLAWTLANDLLGLPSVLKQSGPDEEAVS